MGKKDEDSSTFLLKNYCFSNLHIVLQYPWELQQAKPSLWPFTATRSGCVASKKKKCSHLCYQLSAWSWFSWTLQQLVVLLPRFLPGPASPGGSLRQRLKAEACHSLEGCRMGSGMRNSSLLLLLLRYLNGSCSIFITISHPSSQPPFALFAFIFLFSAPFITLHSHHSVYSVSFHSLPSFSALGLEHLHVLLWHLVSESEDKQTISMHGFPRKT